MKRGPVGTLALNTALRDAGNPARPGKAEMRTVSGLWREGDRVMQTRNNYQHDISNGDIGTIARIETVEDEEAVTVVWDDRETRLAREDLDDLVLAYAITTHKAQGAEYPVVIAPVTTGHYPLLSAPVLYTAITRARERVVLVGTKRALQIAVRQNHHRRATGLTAALQEAGQRT
jgi:exodeoxyribonuclease V alpha subunit